MVVVVVGETCLGIRHLMREKSIWQCKRKREMKFLQNSRIVDY